MVFLLFFLFFVILFVFLCCSGFEGGSVISLGAFSYSWSPHFFDFLLDALSSFFFYMLLCCGLIAFYYVFHYMFGSSSYGLFWLIVLFMGVMLFLCFSGSLIFTLVFWDLLGLVSFFLILFYSNEASLRASFITLFVSRWGDVGLFVVLSFFSSLLDASAFFFLICCFLVVITKSACYPVISWLLEAMRAPTPVSSLVHSSTLVAAGIWFLSRYFYLFPDSVLSVISCFCLLTIFISGLCACSFVDMKKIVALSTCNNISWCILFFILGSPSLSIIHLLSHGLCKCYLFMSVGDLMSGSGGGQSGVLFYHSRYYGVFGVLVRSILVMSLCGLPFIGFFFSKHAFFSSVFWSGGVSYFLCFLGCFILTYVYSFRFLFLLLGVSSGLSVGYMSNFTLVGFLFLVSSLINFSGCVVFVDGFEPSPHLCWLILFLQAIGIVGGLFFFKIGCFYELHSVLSSYLYGGDFVISLFYSKFLFLVSLGLSCLYRWEICFIRFLHSGWLGFSVHTRTLNSFSFLGMCLLFIGFMFFIVC